MFEFVMPALGADMDEGTLNEWLVKPGDIVTRGQVVAVVETTKAAVEIECWHDGVVQELLVPIGETVSVGTPLATMRAPDEPAPPATPPRPEKTRAARPTGPRRRTWVSPAARRLAASHGVDINSVTGTGPQGAVTIVDVEHAAAAMSQSAGAKRSASPRAISMRQSIAAAMSRSHREIPHYYLADEVVMDNALAWLAEHNSGQPITERVLPAVLAIKATGLAARRFTDFNGFWRDDEYRPAGAVHVGIAISLRGGGLVAPAIHDVPDKDLDQLMSDLTDLVTRARAGSLRSSEVSDPTITVTNLGDNSVDAVFGLIYPPQVALVGFGKPAERVCVVNGGIRVATTVRTTLSADHRANDGHRGATFLAAINHLLQQPEQLNTRSSDGR
ncbi:dihydrolipoamide acetyltransferase family protein [Mycolicibacterium smegmatis]|uniref:dihydrolipoamide acetyltransferase family protein n=1 Tax=Mycolicibacterium smegmatis TaxID=1772 RepID=UPI001303C8B3|nr:dihydrolipoamide acetyltransferase family protein [Mycolicibacterium smegmatis]